MLKNAASILILNFIFIPDQFGERCTRFPAMCVSIVKFEHVRQRFVWVFLRFVLIIGHYQFNMTNASTATFHIPLLSLRRRQKPVVTLCMVHQRRCRRRRSLGRRRRHHSTLSLLRYILHQSSVIKTFNNKTDPLLKTIYCSIINSQF